MKPQKTHGRLKTTSNILISRRVFAAGMLTASMSVGLGPLIVQSITKASTGSGSKHSPINQLQRMISDQLKSYNNLPHAHTNALQRALQDEEFQAHLGQRLLQLRPISPKV